MNQFLCLFLTSTPDDALIAALEAEGLSVQVVTTFDNAIKVAESYALLVIIVDIELAQVPIICAALKENPVTQSTPLLVVTENNPTARLIAQTAGADDILTAPPDSVELMLRLRPYLPEHRKKLPDNRTAWGGVAETLSHDLKSPLATIVSSLELLREMMMMDTPEHVPLVENSLNAARRQTYLIEDMLDFMLIQNRTMPINLQSVSFLDVIHALLPQVTKLGEHKGVSITDELPTSLPPILVDGFLLQRVLNALFDNALKFCIRGGEIKIQAWAEEMGVMVRLMDDGRLILPEYDDEIFELSQQTEARREGSRSSVAMALPFARAAIRYMGGDVVAFSGEEWTTFTLRLPLAEKIEDQGSDT